MSTPVRPVTELPRSVPVGTARRTMRTVQRIRLHFVFGVLLLAFGALLGRLAFVQLVHGDEWRAKVLSQGGWVNVKPVRGGILDRQGRVFAYSRPVRHVIVDAGGRYVEKTKAFEYTIAPADLGRFSTTLSDVLDGVPSALEIRALIQGRRQKGDFSRSGWAEVTVRRGIDDPRIISRLDETKLEGMHVRYADRRDYPNGSWAGPVLGLALSSDASHADAGVDGVEKELDAILSGTSTRHRRATDGCGRFLAPKIVDPTGDGDGRAVWLTLDLVIQGYCEQALDAMCREWNLKDAVAIVMDPANGDILAMASRPIFDPSLGKDALGEFGMVRNHATQAQVEVGSTFKPFTVARALERGVVGVDEVFELPRTREFALKGKTDVIHDSHDGGDPHGAGTVVDVIAESNNPDVAEMAFRLGTEGIKQLVADLGLTAKFPLLGYGVRENAGYVYWDKIGMFGFLRCGFGHSLTQTPLRLISNFCAFARDDFRPVTPRLLLAIGGDALDEMPLGAPLLTDPRKKDAILRGLRACVTVGTASKTVSSPKYDIAGKTGTAQKPGRDNVQYYSCSFVGYAPADAPRLVCLVMALEPRAKLDPTKPEPQKPYGGAVAGPAVRSILERSLEEYLAVPPKNAAAPVTEPIRETGSTAAPDGVPVPAKPLSVRTAEQPR
jgi:cell division protein FtsI/penicillin-binding protein 2